MHSGSVDSSMGINKAVKVRSGRVATAVGKVHRFPPLWATQRRVVCRARRVVERLLGRFLGRAKTASLLLQKSLQPACARLWQERSEAKRALLLSRSDCLTFCNGKRSIEVFSSNLDLIFICESIRKAHGGIFVLLRFENRCFCSLHLLKIDRIPAAWHLLLLHHLK